MSLIRTPSNRRGKSQKGNVMVEFALALPLVFLFSVGASAVAINMDRFIQVTHVARFGGNIYSRDVDFSKDVFKDLLLKSASGLGITKTGGTGVIYLTTVTVAQAGANNGLPVMTHRVAIGNPSLAPSRIGTPANIQSSGHVPNYETNAQARATLPAGMTMTGTEVRHFAEVFLDGTPSSFWGVIEINQMYSTSVF